MSKSSSDKIFSSYVSHCSPWLKIGLVALGVLLIIFSGAFDGNKEQSDEEVRLAELCAMIDGAGEVKAIISYERENAGFSAEGDMRVSAVAVFCDGADNVRVRADIKELVSSLYGIGMNRITVN